MKSWRRLAITSEGGPICEEIVFAIAADMFAEGELIEGVWVLVQYDAYAREQDLDQLQTSDVSYDSVKVALVFGVSDRGESVKTGSNQGVILFRGFISDLLLALKQHVKVGKVFRKSQAQIRKAWHRVLQKLRILHTGPVHSLRHSGPSNDIAHERLSLEGVRRRGRWAILASVQRYSKTFALVRYRVNTPTALFDTGSLLVENPRAGFSRALRSCRVACDDGLRRKLISALELGKTKDSSLEMKLNVPASAYRKPSNQDLISQPASVADFKNMKRRELESLAENAGLGDLKQYKKNQLIEFLVQQANLRQSGAKPTDAPPEPAPTPAEASRRSLPVFPYTYGLSPISP